MDSFVLKSFIPEIFLSLFILAQLLYNSYLSRNPFYNLPTIDREIGIQIALALIIIILLFLNLKIEAFLHTFLFLNSFGIYLIKIFFILINLFVLFTIINCFKIQQLNFFEYFTIYLLSILSLLLLISSFDLLTAYLVIEMQAISFYILACFNRNSAYSSEAGLKYFISGSFISGIFLLGCSLIYGTVGTLNFNTLNTILFLPLDSNFQELNLILLIGCLLVTVTFLFKISAVPFHSWSPDVYEGAPLSSTIIFSIIPKIALFTFFIRWLSIFLENYSLIEGYLFFSGLLSIIIGSFFALNQKRLKRLIIYSSIAQGGFLVAALAVNSLESISSIYFFLIIYLITSVLIWMQFSNLYVSQKRLNYFFETTQTPLYLSTLSNFFKSNTLWAFSFLLIFFSLAGIPPLGGFLSKIFILFSIIKAQTLTNTFLIILASIFSIFYYLRVIKIVFFEFKNISGKNESFHITIKTLFFDIDSLILAFLLFLLLFLFFNPTLLILCNNCIVLESNFFNFI